MTLAYREFVDFLAHGATRDEVLAFVPSPSTRQRVAELVHKERDSSLSEDEKSELDHYLHVEHLMRLAKARARELSRR